MDENICDEMPGPSNKTRKKIVDEETYDKTLIHEEAQETQSADEGCSCRKCVKTDKYELCCNQDEEISEQLAKSKLSCITQHKVFEDLCLNKVYLFVSGSNDQEKREATNDEFCRIARRNFVKWIWGRADLNKRLPCCVVEAIWSILQPESITESWLFGDKIGTMVIINNENYPDGHKRVGSQEDVKRLKELANNLNVLCTLIEDKSDVDIMKHLKSECKNVMASDLCFICVILSHGDKDQTILDVKKNKIELSSMTNSINEEIQNKDVAKLCFVQACRGTTFSVEDENVFHIEDPGKENFLITYCSVHGHSGERSNSGTPFITELCKSLNKSHKLEIMQVLTAMKHNMEKCKYYHNLLASSTTRLTNELYLQPISIEAPCPPECYETLANESGLFLIIGDPMEFEDDILALQKIAKLWGFKENNVKMPCLELKQEAKSGKELNKNALLDKIKEHARSLDAVSCLVCAIISNATSSNNSDSIKLNYKKDYDLKEITTLFRGSNSSYPDKKPIAEALRGKPKLFFVQKSPSLVSSDAVSIEVEDADLPHHPDADVMITFSEAGLRDKTKPKGITAFYDALLHCVTNDRDPDYYNLFKILTQVRKRMSDQKHPVPWTQTQLRKEVYFAKSETMQ